MTRASLALLKGDIALSLSYNVLCIPLTIAFLIALVWWFIDLLRRQTTFIKFVNQDIPEKYKFLLISIVIIDWAVNIIRL
jgi:hypothetical protein